MAQLISTHGAATWVNQRPNGGIVIQQGPSYVQLSHAELARLIQAVTQPVDRPSTPILRYTSEGT